MSNEKLARVGKCADIPLNEGRRVLVNGEDIAVFNLGQTCRAIANHCPHKGGPLSDGIVTGDVVICPLHARKIDLNTGEVRNEPEKVKVYNLIVDEGELFLKC